MDFTAKKSSLSRAAALGVAALLFAVFMAGFALAQSNDGFSRPYTLNFKFSSPDQMQGTEVLRRAWNQSASGGQSSAPAGEVQGADNLNNVVQFNTTLVINGDNNTIDQAGGSVDADQTSDATQQSATNNKGTCSGVLNAQGC